MSGKASLVGWPVGVARESVAEPIRISIEGPSAMFLQDDPEMVAAYVTIKREISRLVKKRSGVELQWDAEDQWGNSIKQKRVRGEL